MFNPKTQYAKIAFDTILFYKTTGQIRKIEETKIKPDLKLNLACIVYIYDAKDTLISYFGNVYPQKSNLYDEIISNSIIAADNTKNGQLSKESMESIKVYVDIVSQPQKVENIDELKPHKQGIFIKADSGKSGFVLPGTRGIKSGAAQIDLAKKNAGVEKSNPENIDIMSFKVTRYD